MQLLLNVFAHSRNCFQEFVARPSNWFDTVIVLQSLVTVILLAAGVMEAPSGMLAAAKQRTILVPKRAL